MKIHDISPVDLNKHPVWYFVSDDDVTIAPVLDASLLEDNAVIVKTIFTDGNNKEFIGYLYWGEPSKIQFIKPVIFLSDDGTEEVSFWKGIREPDSEELKMLCLSCKLPLHYKSIEMFGLYSLTGTIKGIYYFTKDHKEAFK